MDKEERKEIKDNLIKFLKERNELNIKIGKLEEELGIFHD